MRHTKPIFWIAAVVLLGMIGCTKEETITGGETLPTGEAVSVTLALCVDDLQTPGAKSKSADMGTSRVIHSERSEAMLLELIEEPAQAQNQPQTRAMDDSQIANIWVFQYDGTEPTSKLIRKDYYASYTEGMKFELYARASQRVAVIANTFNATFGNDQTLNTSSYQTLLDKTATVNIQNHVLTNGGDNIPFSGTSTEAVKEASSINMNLMRNVAQVIFKVKTGNVVANKWTIQMRDVPNVSYWMAQRDDTPFPASVTPVNYAVQTITDMSSSNFSEFSWYVPTNLRGTVDGTTAKQRVTNAPAGATYVKITGETTSPTGVSYTIHLGADFATDYNVNPNYKYTYQVTLYTDPSGTDSRVESIEVKKEEGVYVGMFAGELVGDDTNGWAFSKPLYVSLTDEVDGSTDTWQWATATGDHSSLAGSKTDGRANTWNLNKGSGGSLTNFPAANRCFKRNNSTQQANKDALLWYLPAQEQLMGIWVTHTGNIAPFVSLTYRSSSEYNSTDSWFVNFFGSGSTYYGTAYSNKANASRVRCVREVTP